MGNSALTTAKLPLLYLVSLTQRICKNVLCVHMMSTWVQIQQHGYVRSRCEYISHNISWLAAACLRSAPLCRRQRPPQQWTVENNGWRGFELNQGVKRLLTFLKFRFRVLFRRHSQIKQSKYLENQIQASPARISFRHSESAALRLSGDAFSSRLGHVTETPL